MIRNVVLYLALRAAQALIPLIPLSLAYKAADVVAFSAYALVRGARRSVLANLAVVTGASPSSVQVRRLALEAFVTDARNWIDTLRIHLLSDDDILHVVHMEGWERIEEALAGGKGLILVSAHLGNFDLVGQVIRSHGFQVTIPVERVSPAVLFDFLMSERRSKGIKLVPIEEAPRAMLRGLRAGEMVGLVGDRHVAGKSVDVQFFGQPARLPRGPASLARHTGAPVLVGVGIRSGSGEFQGHVSQPISIERTHDSESDDRNNAQRIATVLEGYIARFPGQWLAFGPVWVNPREKAAGTMKRTEATI